jgi:hypothetical protein
LVSIDQHFPLQSRFLLLVLLLVVVVVVVVPQWGQSGQPVQEEQRAARLPWAGRALGALRAQ